MSIRIAIIGTGGVGRVLARGLRKASHQVVLGTRDPTDGAMRALAAEVGAALAMPADAARSAELAILALPWSAAARWSRRGCRMLGWSRP